MTIVEEGVSSVYAAPGERGSVATYRPRYGHYIGDEFVEPIKGQYFENITPVTGKPFCEVGRGTVEDIDRAVDVAWKAFQSWKRTTPAERANILNKIADRMEQNLEAIAVAETWENGKPVRETLAAGRNPAADSGAMAVPMSANLFAALDTKKKKSKVRGLPTRMNDSCAERRPRVLRRFPVGGLSRTPRPPFSKKIGRSRYRASASL